MTADLAAYDYSLLDTETVTWFERYPGLAENDSGGQQPTFRPGVDLADAIIWPGASSETQVAGDVAIDSLTVMFRRWVPGVKATDEFQARGDRYRVQGPPARLHNPGDGDEVMTITLLRRA